MNYIIQTIAFQLLFLVIYDFFLKKETFFNWNRAYLLLTPVLSIVLPFIQLESFKTTVPQNYVFLLPEIVLTPNNNSTTVVESSLVPSLNFWQWLLICGSLLSLVWFLYKLIQIYLLKKEGDIRYYKNYTRIAVNKDDTAFSFFKNIFIGKSLLKKQHQHIIEHELVHIKEKHSLDLLFFEVLRILFWFNPLIYIYQARITELHEFIADAKTVKNNKKEHYQLLLEEVFKTERISFINQFFNHSLIKKRIVMLQKSKSKKVWQLKYLLMIPVVVGMLFYTSCEKENSEINSELVQSEHTELFEKYYNELQKRINNGEELYKISSEINKKSDPKKIKNIEDYYEGQALFLLKIENYIENGIEFSNYEDLKEKLSSRTYDEYLVWANGPKGKEQRELNSQKLYSFDKNGELKIDDEGDIPFTVISEKPMFKDCDGVSDEQQFDCFKEKLDNHVKTTFKYPQEAQDNNIEGRVYVNFRINTDGSITVLNTRAPAEVLDTEGRRIIESLPTLIPGKDESGTARPVTFAYPIAFKLK